jgi:hypothetical protein
MGFYFFPNSHPSYQCLQAQPTALGRSVGPDFFTICGRAVKPNYLKSFLPILLPDGNGMMPRV